MAVPDVQLCVELLCFAHMPDAQGGNIDEMLCREVARLTQCQALLCLNRGQKPGEQHITPCAISFPVRFQHRTYGTLHLTAHSGCPASPALSLSTAHLIALTSGLLLYANELSALLETQSQQVKPPAYIHLTRREREVLNLICCGLSRQEIAEALSIAPSTVETHTRHLSQKLGTHSERDIPLAAFRANLL